MAARYESLIRRYYFINVGPSRRFGKEQVVESSEKDQEKYSQYKASFDPTLVISCQYLYNTFAIPLRA